MILDTSALLAILLNEPEAPFFASSLEDARVIRLSVASYLEASIFVERNGDAVQRALLDRFIEEFDVRLEPVTVEQIRYAREAFQRYGKGLHAASFNFGDCFTYALARAYREPLLYKGNDFGHTDLASVADSVQ